LYFPKKKKKKKNSDGSIVVIGGVVASTNAGNVLSRMNNTWVYTPSSNSWEIKPLAATAQGSYPSARSDHSAVVSK
jgi:hypothetical protein